MGKQQKGQGSKNAGKKGRKASGCETQGRAQRPGEGDFAALASELRNLGLWIDKMEADGNCLFRSFADQLEGRPQCHERYRRECVEFMAGSPDQFMSFLSEEDLGKDAFEGYLEKMGKLGTWGTQLELMALCQKYQVNAIVHQHRQPSYEMEVAPAERRCLQFAFHDGQHYNSVRFAKGEKPQGGGGGATASGNRRPAALLTLAQLRRALKGEAPEKEEGEECRSAGSGEAEELENKQQQGREKSSSQGRGVTGGYPASCAQKANRKEEKGSGESPAGPGPGFTGEAEDREEDEEVLVDGETAPFTVAQLWYLLQEEEELLSLDLRKLLLLRERQELSKKTGAERLEIFQKIGGAGGRCAGKEEDENRNFYEDLDSRQLLALLSKGLRQDFACLAAAEEAKLIEHDSLSQERHIIELIAERVPGLNSEVQLLYHYHYWALAAVAAEDEEEEWEETTPSGRRPERAAVLAAGESSESPVPGAMPGMSGKKRAQARLRMAERKKKAREEEEQLRKLQREVDLGDPEWLLSSLRRGKDGEEEEEEEDLRPSKALALLAAKKGLLRV